MQLLETLAGYIGIAVQNARLYKSLEEKVGQYERLKEFNENIVESISVGVMAVDLEDRIESWNSQMEVMFALPRAEALGRPLTAVLPPAFLEEYYRVRPTQGIHNLYKFRLATTAGDTRVTNIAIAPLVSKNFSVIGRLIIVDDITERIELESQLTQAEKLSSIGLLAAGVAHEVNTPLAVISSYAQMLAKQVHGDDKQSSLLEKITKQTFRASEIVNSLLNFSRTSGTEFSDVDVNRVIKDTLTLLEHQFKTARIKCRAGLVSGPAGHPRQHRQAAAGVSELVPERERRHVRRRHAEDQHRQRTSRGGAGLRHRQRHRAGAHSPHLRSVLHHQDQAQDRAQRRHGTGAVGYLRNHSGARRQDPGRQRARTWDHICHGIPHDQEGGQCLKQP